MLEGWQTEVIAENGARALFPQLLDPKPCYGPPMIAA